MDTAKIKPKLVTKLENSKASDLLEVVLQLESTGESPAISNTQSRAEKVVAMKEAFNQDVAPVEEAIRKVGGEITGRAWINQTVRARIPAQKVKDLCDLEKVAAMDTSHPLEAE